MQGILPPSDNIITFIIIIIIIIIISISSISSSSSSSSSNHRHVSAIHVAIFRVLKTRIQMQL